MRRDGMLVPFAAFKGSRWLAPWPATARNRELPINMSAVPDEWWGGAAPETWTVHLPGGVTRQATARTPRVYRSFCDTRIGVTTDYRSAEPIPMPPTDPYPKDGLALAPDIELLPIETIDRASPETARLATLLMPQFDQAEDKTVAMIRNSEGWVHPLSEPARKAVPVTIEAWYRAPMDEPGWTASYIEAVRQVQRRPDWRRDRLWAGDGGHRLDPSQRRRPAQVAHAADRAGDLLRPPRRQVHAAVRANPPRPAGIGFISSPASTRSGTRWRACRR